MNAMLFKPLFSLLSPSGHAARLSILIYHRVLAEPDALLPGVPDAATFRWHMRFLRRHLNPLPLDEAVQRLRAGSLPSRAVCVTFDDGYADNATVALPVLREEGVPATFFIATAYLNGGRMFNDTVMETVRRLPTKTVDLTPEGIGIREIRTDADRVALARELILGIKYLEFDERQERAEALAQRLGLKLPDDLMMSDAQVRQLVGPLPAADPLPSQVSQARGTSTSTSRLTPVTTSSRVSSTTTRTSLPGWSRRARRPPPAPPKPEDRPKNASITSSMPPKPAPPKPKGSPAVRPAGVPSSPKRS